MNGTLSGRDAELFLVYLLLFLFGVVYNLMVDWIERKGYMKGYTSLFVVLGVGVTVAATAVISPAFALVTAGAFVASGAPMIAGSMWRHMRERESELERLRRAVKDDAP